jgi:hypothetical protein
VPRGRPPTLSVDLSKARSLIHGCKAASTFWVLARGSAAGLTAVLFSVILALVRSTGLAGAAALLGERLRWLVTRLMEASAVPLLRTGAAASGRRTLWEGAQPRSCTYVPMLPARAAVGAPGGGVWWPFPGGWRPSPWGLVVTRRASTAVMAYLETLSGHCSCNRTADASS